MASAEKLGQVRYGTLVPDNNGRDKSRFVTHPTVIGLFKVCFKKFNFLPCHSDIYEVSRVLPKEERSIGYDKWLRWYNKGGAKRKRGAS